MSRRKSGSCTTRSASRTCDSVITISTGIKPFSLQFAQHGSIKVRVACSQLAIKWGASISNGYSGPTVANGRVYITDRIDDPATSRPKERVHCLDSQTGKPIWVHTYDCDYSGVSYPDGPRASVTIDQGHAYALGAKGRMHCLDAATGSVLWSRDLYKEYDINLPIWGISPAPVIEGGLVIL